MVDWSSDWLQFGALTSKQSNPSSFCVFSSLLNKNFVSKLQPTWTSATRQHTQIGILRRVIIQRWDAIRVFRVSLFVWTRVFRVWWSVFQFGFETGQVGVQAANVLIDLELSCLVFVRVRRKDNIYQCVPFRRFDWPTGLFHRWTLCISRISSRLFWDGSNGSRGPSISYYSNSRASSSRLHSTNLLATNEEKLLGADRMSFANSVWLTLNPLVQIMHSLEVSRQLRWQIFKTLIVRLKV